MRGGLATPRYWWAQPNIFGINGGYNSDPGIYHMLFHGEGVRTLNPGISCSLRHSVRVHMKPKTCSHIPAW